MVGSHGGREAGLFTHRAASVPGDPDPVQKHLLESVISSGNSLIFFRRIYPEGMNILFYTAGCLESAAIWRLPYSEV